MLLVPQSLTACWSALTPQAIEAESLLAACIDKAPLVQAMSLSLKKVHQAGWRSPEAHALYADACSELSDWCVRNEHYVHNVSTLQDVSFDTGMNLCTESDRRRAERPRRRWRFLRRQTEFEAKVMERIRWKSLYGDLPTWAKAVRKLVAGQAVLIAAPLCLTQDGEGGEIDACLCDYPPLVRTPQDAKLALLMSGEGKRDLLAKLGSQAAAWHPFCRILGIFRQEPQGPRVEVLQVELASPLPSERDYWHEPNWDEALIKETASFIDAREATWAQDELKKFESGKIFGSLRLGSMSGLLSRAEEDEEERLARGIAFADSAMGLVRETGSPFEGLDAFWCSLATLLPSWKTHFPLGDDKVAALLIAFDKAYGLEWHQVAANPALDGVLRYTPAAIAEARAHIEGLLA